MVGTGIAVLLNQSLVYRHSTYITVSFSGFPKQDSLPECLQLVT